jgi:hypothetical protein
LGCIRLIWDENLFKENSMAKLLKINAKQNEKHNNFSLMKIIINVALP